MNPAAKNDRSLKTGLKFSGVGRVYIRIGRNLGLHQGLNIGEVIANIPCAITIGGREMANVCTEFKVMLAPWSSSGVST